MSSNEYIHINEAVKEHGKTRQTFYNYMHKGLIRTKKVNNKVYLNTEDVEQLMSGYIPNTLEPEQITEISEADEHPYEEIIEAEDIAQNTSPQPSTKNDEQRVILKDLARLHQQYYTLQDTILQKVNASKQDLFYDTKVLSQNMEQRLSLGIGQKVKDLEQHIQPLTQRIQHIATLHKKSLFRAGYASFILLNMLITMYIL